LWCQASLDRIPWSSLFSFSIPTTGHPPTILPSVRCSVALRPRATLPSTVRTFWATLRLKSTTISPLQQRQHSLSPPAAAVTTRISGKMHFHYSIIATTTVTPPLPRPPDARTHTHTHTHTHVTPPTHPPTHTLYYTHTCTSLPKTQHYRKVCHL
jgi:hypothetical protein